MTTLLKDKKENEINDDAKVELLNIIVKMKENELPEVFIFDCILLASKYEGVQELIKLWYVETNENERNEIISDIQELINDSKISKNDTKEINLSDLNTISKNIRLFKDKLLTLVNNNGGIKLLANKSGIPQPSLSRFFNSNSIPQRATLLKIKNSLDIETLDIENWEDNI